MVRGLQKPDMRSCDNDLVLCDKCRVCLSLRHITVFDYLLTSLVRRLVTSTAINGPVEKLLHDIEETQKHPYTGVQNQVLYHDQNIVVYDCTWGVGGYCGLVVIVPPISQKCNFISLGGQYIKNWS